MNEKRYLKWYNKIGYGSGDIAGNVVYAFLTFFVMIYLSDTIGLNPGIIGTLMAVAKIFDGISDVIFGSLIDKTHTKWVRPVPGCCGLTWAAVSACSQSSPFPLPGARPHSTPSSSSST